MSLKEMIDEVQRQGYVVNIQHIRYQNDEGISPKGGYTLASITPNYGSDLAYVIQGKAECSFEDNYNKKLGAQIALGRAMHKVFGRHRSLS